ncbi:Uu.00g098490.m01.CDS01 [Anthostomella pinea]|uniref:Uu.00g098490.m01.CDS01 n=1 Tax=Anthostomella pinea TaxID=933095 RepID=A0AAI8YF45_9PEZI|nr:Uu.00g098490.m01.CDS01 [Anthostomella pinea]
MSSTASAFARLKPHSLSSRTVFVKCIPAPVSFSERRAVYTALQKVSFETIETFKKLEDNSCFIAVTTKPGTAAALVNDSPLTRTIISHQQDADAAASPGRASWGSEFDLRGSITEPVSPLPANKATQATAASADLGLSHKTFTLRIFPANTSYNHVEEVKKSPLHGPWPDNDVSETFVSAALNRIIPAGAMAPALRDWQTANQLTRESTSFAGEGREGAAHALMGKKRLSEREHFLLERIRRRQQAEGIPTVMKSLALFADLSAARSRPSKTSRESPQHYMAPEESVERPVELPSNEVSSAQHGTLLDDDAFKELLMKAEENSHHDGTQPQLSRHNTVSNGSHTTLDSQTPTSGGLAKEEPLLDNAESKKLLKEDEETAPQLPKESKNSFSDQANSAKRGPLLDGAAFNKLLEQED